MRQVSTVWVDWFLEVYMTIMADLEHLGLGPFECANINSMPSGTHALFMAARTCAQVTGPGFHITFRVERGPHAPCLRARERTGEVASSTFLELLTASSLTCSSFR